MVILHIISGGEVGGSKKHLLTLVNNINSSDIKKHSCMFYKRKTI